MKKPTKNLKKINPLLLVMAVSVAVILIIFFFFRRINDNNLPLFKNIETQPVTENLPIIQNAADLNNLDSELNNTDLNKFDRELDQLEKDFSSF